MNQDEDNDEGIQKHLEEELKAEISNNPELTDDIK